MDGAPKFKTNQGPFVVRKLGLATINLYTKYEVSMFTHYERWRNMQKLGWFGGLGVPKVIGNITVR